MMQRVLTSIFPLSCCYPDLIKTVGVREETQCQLLNTHMIITSPMRHVLFTREEVTPTGLSAHLPSNEESASEANCATSLRSIKSTKSLSSGE